MGTLLEVQTKEPTLLNFHRNHSLLFPLPEIFSPKRQNSALCFTFQLTSISFWIFSTIASNRNQNISQNRPVPDFFAGSYFNDFIVLSDNSKTLSDDDSIHTRCTNHFFRTLSPIRGTRIVISPNNLTQQTNLQPFVHYSPRQSHTSIISRSPSTSNTSPSRNMNIAFLTNKDFSPPRSIQSLIKRTSLEHTSLDSTPFVERHIEGFSVNFLPEVPPSLQKNLNTHRNAQSFNFFFCWLCI